MTDSAASALAISLGVGVFLVVVAVGWRSVQNRRILRLHGANGQETIVVASEDDDVSSVVTTITTETPLPEPAPDPSASVVNSGAADRTPAHEFGRSPVKNQTAGEAEAEVPRKASS